VSVVDLALTLGEGRGEGLAGLQEFISLLVSASESERRNQMVFASLSLTLTLSQSEREPNEMTC
jgi:hypothetical protein